MIIVICGSLVFHAEMRRVERELITLGHEALVPKSLDLIEAGSFHKPVTVADRLAAENRYDFIREHFKKIEYSNAILVVNPAHHGIEGYIGGNTLMEMGIAFYLGKKIYLMNAIPTMDYTLEIAAMKPVVLGADLGLI